MNGTRIYWRPQGISRTMLVLITLLAVVGLMVVEYGRARRRQPWYTEKHEAATLALEAMKVIKAGREERRIPIDHETDPALTGLVGSLMTPTTSNNGSLAAKQISVNPNFAAVLVQMLKKAGVQRGDTVAIGCSGSFPALNACAYAAVKVLDLRPVIITSVSASQWGANHPEYLWPDMERVLQERKVFPFRSVAASVGGIEDRGLGLSAEGRRMLLAGIERNQLPLIDPKDFADGVRQRMAVYRRQAGDSPIRCYISIGGGTTSVGTRAGKRLFEPGLNLRNPAATMPADSVMAQFIDQGVPAIHLVRIQDLARRYGLETAPGLRIAPVGQGEIYHREEYNPYLAAGALALITVSILWVNPRFHRFPHCPGRDRE